MQLNDLELFVHDTRHYSELCEEYGWDQLPPEEVLEYGEGWEAMASHVSDMGGLDRQIFQECQVSAGKVVAPHPNIEAPHPYWLGPRWISRKLKCSVRDAAALADSWVILNVTKSMVDKFVDWLNQEGKFPAGLQYFMDLASKVAEVEVFNPEDAFTSNMTDFHKVEAATYEDAEGVTWERINVLSYETVEPEESTNASPVAYHVIGDYTKPPHSWLSHQPFRFKSLVSSVQSADSLKALGEIGKRVYRDNGFNNRSQAGVFWTHYGLRKNQLRS